MKHEFEMDFTNYTVTCLLCGYSQYSATPCNTSCRGFKTMKIEDLKIGDIVKVRFNSERPSEDQGQITNKEIDSEGVLKFIVSTNRCGKVWFTAPFILAKLEPVPIQYKEIPIEKPKSIKFNFIPMSYSMNNARFSGNIIEMDGYVSNQSYSSQRLTIPLVPNGLIPNVGKAYSVEIKEL